MQLLQGYPPARWPKEHSDPEPIRQSLGLKLLFAGDASMGVTADPYRLRGLNDGVPKPRAERLQMGTLLAALEVAPWKAAAPASPIDRRKKGRSRLQAWGGTGGVDRSARPTTAMPGSSCRQSAVHAAARPSTAPPRCIVDSAAQY